MRWGRAGLVLPAALLALAGCGEISSGEQPDEVGSNKAGDFGEREQESVDAKENAARRPAEMTGRAAEGAAPEGYRSRQDVVGSTGATPGPQSGQGSGVPAPGEPARAGFEQEAQEGKQAGEKK